MRIQMPGKGQLPPRGLTIKSKA